MPARGHKLLRGLAAAKFFFLATGGSSARSRHVAKAFVLGEHAICYFVSRSLATRIMKLASLAFFLSFCLLLIARADITIVQKVEGADQGGEVTIKIKGDKARIEATPQLTTIVDGKTGEMTNLMNDRKAVVRISAEKMRAAAEMMSKFNEQKRTAEKPKLTPTGKKATINGYETEQYVCETPTFKATYWIAPKYPDGAAILRQLQLLNSEAWKPRNMGMPDYRDFPGLPIKTVVSMSGNQVTTTLTSITQDPLNDVEFSVPKDFQEVKAPEMSAAPPQQNEKKPAAEASPKS